MTQPRPTLPAASTPVAAARKPRGRSRPSERNLRIYEAVRLHGRTQQQLARETGLSQGRVSQICRQVAAWRDAAACAVGASPPDAAHRAQVERQLLKRQLEQVCRTALAQLERQRQPLVTERHVRRGTASWTEIIRRDQRPDARWIKIAARASNLILELDDRQADQMQEDAARLAALVRQAQQVMDQQRAEAGNSAASGGPRNGYRTSINSSYDGPANSPDSAPRAAANDNATSRGTTLCGDPAAGGERPAERGEEKCKIGSNYERPASTAGRGAAAHCP
jgi:hypothetical protein